MKKRIFMGMVVAMAVIAIAGCRRKDFREVTIDVPGMTADNKQTIRDALFFYDGVVRESLKFDLEKKQLTLRFDSLKVAQTNLRMAIEQKGIAVKYPPNTTGVAGYINKRASEVSEGLYLIDRLAEALSEHLNRQASGASGEAVRSP